jgi:ankyrin repeat protein
MNTCVSFLFLSRRLMTPIMYAARDGHTQVVALLVAHGAEVNAQDENGYTVRNAFQCAFCF